MSEPEFLRYCTNPLCGRVVPANFLGHRQASYCCAPCADADGRHEIEDHSVGCDARWQERKDRRVKYAR